MIAVFDIQTLKKKINHNFNHFHNFNHCWMGIIFSEL